MLVFEQIQGVNVNVVGCKEDEKLEQSETRLLIASSRAEYTVCTQQLHICIFGLATSHYFPLGAVYLPEACTHKPLAASASRRLVAHFAHSSIELMRLLSCCFFFFPVIVLWLRSSNKLAFEQDTIAFFFF